jgi:hypothetical protein
MLTYFIELPRTSARGINQIKFPALAKNFFAIKKITSEF